MAGREGAQTGRQTERKTQTHSERDIEGKMGDQFDSFTGKSKRKRYIFDQVFLNVYPDKFTSKVFLTRRSKCVCVGS